MKTVVLIFLSLFLTQSCQNKKAVVTQTPQENAIIAETEPKTVAAPKTETSSEQQVVEVSNPVVGEKPKEEVTYKEEVIQKGIKAEYEALSRGYFSKIIFQNNKVTIAKDRNAADKGNEVSMTTKEAAELTKLLKAIKPETLPKLKWPSEARYYDGAAHANLTITVDGKVYTGAGFDHGKPPAEIAKFVEKLLSIAEKK
jgi:hypothetical protein